MNIEERKGLTDDDQLDFAIKEGRAILSHDPDFVKICEDKEHPGILFIPRRRKPEEIVKRVIRILEILDMEDLKGEVIFV